MKKALSEISARMKSIIVKRTLRLCAPARNSPTQRCKDAKKNLNLHFAEIFILKTRRARRATYLFNSLL